MSTKTITAEVVAIASANSKTDREGFVVSFSGMEKDDTGVRRFSYDLLDTIAINAGFPDWDCLSAMVRAALDRGELTFVVEYREAGQTWENQNTKQKGVIEKSHWAIVGIPQYIPSEEIAEELRIINRELVKDRAMKKPRRKASRESSKPADANEIFAPPAATAEPVAPVESAKPVAPIEEEPPF